MTIPSYLIKIGDIVEPVESSRKLNVIEESLAKAEQRGLPSWIEMDIKNLKGKILHFPSREEIALPVQEQLIIELYSK